jgi:hypothetical protein
MILIAFACLTSCAGPQRPASVPSPSSAVLAQPPNLPLDSAGLAPRCRPTPTAAPTFATILSRLPVLADTDRPTLEIRLSKASFSIYEHILTPIDEREFRHVGRDERALPSMRYRSADIDLVLTLPDGVEVEERAPRGPGKAAKTWLKREPRLLGQYPIEQWPQFLSEAVERHNLDSVTELVSGKARLLQLQLAHPGPPSFLGAVGRTVQLSPDFYRWMKLAARYPPHVGDKGLVILVHEPHWDVSGQMQLLSGLQHLAAGNPGKSLVFLVEGAYPRQSRRIDLNGLDQAIEKARQGGPSAPLVHRLLARFLIDGPTAYRLLYQPGIESLAIDDLDHLPTSHPSAVKDWASEREVLLALDSAAEGAKELSADCRRELRGLVAEELLHGAANVNEADPALMVEYWEERRAILDSLAQLSCGGQLAAKHHDFLREQASSCGGQKLLYEDVLKRDVTMTLQIADRVRNSPVNELPLAFIGSAHTAGIARGLSEKGIGYIVIEPRLPLYPDDQSSDRFDEQSYGGANRSTGLEKALAKLKLPVAIPDFQVKKLVGPWLKKDAAQLASDRAAFAKALRERGTGSVEPETVTNAVAQNGYLSAAKLVVAEGPPAKYKNALLAFDSGAHDGQGEVALFATRAQSWEGGELERALGAMRAPRAAKSGALLIRPRVTVYRDEPTKHIFKAVHDESNKTYLIRYEGPTSLEGLLAPADLGQDGEIRAHVRLAIRMHKKGRIVHD